MTDPERLCDTSFQVLERYPRGLGDLNTRRVMWQLLKGVDYIHSNKVRISVAACVLCAREFAAASSPPRQ